MPTPTTTTRHPVVLRFAGLSPSDLAKYEMHRKRTGGDIGHVDRSRVHLNTPLIGTSDWAADALNILEARKAENFFDELTSLKARNRKKDILQRTVEGPRNPWRSTRHGPMREVILTANKEWFDRQEGNADLTENERLFEDFAVLWLHNTFGADVIHARADRDEAAYHIHAVIAPWKRVATKGAERWMLQPSKHAVIKNYEVAQDDVGAWFSQIGLTRGARHKQAFRDAVAKGETPPEKVIHVRPAEWRRNEEMRLAEEAAALAVKSAQLAKRETEAEALAEAGKRRLAEGAAMIAGAEGIAEGSLEIEETAEGPMLKPKDGAPKDAPMKKRLMLLKRSEAGHKRIAVALSNALRRLTGQAQVEAEQQARASLATQLADVEAAAEAVVGIVAQLPAALREAIAKAHVTLTARIFRATRSLRSQDRAPRPDSPLQSPDDDVQE